MAAPFPRDISEFADDERISYSSTDGKYLLVDDNGVEWEFNEKAGRWMEPIDEEDVLRHQSATYGASPPSDEATVPKPSKKRKAEGKLDKPQKAQKAPENRAIYVTGIPLDVTFDELVETFSRYGGMIAENEDDKKRVTMYKDDNGDFKGDALVVFFKRESVHQAINLLDGIPFRPGGKSNLTIKEADMSYKRNKTADDVEKAATSKTGPRHDKKKQAQKQKEMQQKLVDWSDDEPSVIPTIYNKWSKIVILKHVFTFEELDADIDFYGDVKEQLLELAQTCGEVTNVTLYDKEPEGIASVRFKNAEDAPKFVMATDGRFFGDEQVESWVAESRPRYRKSDKGTASEVEEEQEKEMERFGEVLEAEHRAAAEAKAKAEAEAKDTSEDKAEN